MRSRQLVMLVRLYYALVFLYKPIWIISFFQETNVCAYIPIIIPFTMGVHYIFDNSSPFLISIFFPLRVFLVPCYYLDYLLIYI